MKVFPTFSVPPINREHGRLTPEWLKVAQGEFQTQHVSDDWVGAKECDLFEHPNCARDVGEQQCAKPPPAYIPLTMSFFIIVKIQIHLEFVLGEDMHVLSCGEYAAICGRVSSR